MNWLFRNYGRKKGISMKDPYEVLGLPHGASEEEVKKAYRIPPGCQYQQPKRSAGRRKIQGSAGGI